MNDRLNALRRQIATQSIIQDRSRRRKRLPRQASPRGIRADYSKRIRQVYRSALGGLAPLKKALPDLLRSRRDSAESRELRTLLEELQANFERAVTTLAMERLAREFAEKTAAFQRAQLLKQTRAALGIDIGLDNSGLADLVEYFAIENAKLIRSVPQTVVDEVSRLTTRAVSQGTLWRDLSKQITKRVKLGDSRAKLIARDQVGKLYGQVNATRQKNLGITHFFWRNVGDRRVRPEHVNLDGERFSFQLGAPGEGLPGGPVLCRCYAEPDFNGVLG